MMRKILFICTAFVVSITVSAQGNSGKAKDKQKDKGNVSQTDQPGNSKDKWKSDEHDRKVWEGIGDNSCMKPSKNQPAKVRAAFQRDYPFAVNVRWTKCRGDWTATFANRLFWSTAVYHANGDRRDTRTPILRDYIPGKVIDGIIIRLPGIHIEAAIKIEVPNVMKEIFRIKNVINGITQFMYFNSDGVQVQYDY